MSQIIDASVVEIHESIGEDKPHNGQPIAMIEVSPNGKYLVTYSERDNSIVGWNIEYVEEGQLKPDVSIRVNEIDNNFNCLDQLRVSDERLVCIYVNDRDPRVIDIHNISQKIELDFEKNLYSYHCIFNLNNELILYGNSCNAADSFRRNDGYIWIYSTQTKSNKWKPKIAYRVPKEIEMINISKYDKLFTSSSNGSIYELDLLTGKVVRKILVNEKKVEPTIIVISSNEKFVSMRINGRIIIFSNELEIPIASLDMDNDVQLYNFMNRPGLYSLLPSLSPLFEHTIGGIWNSIMEYCWKECLNNLTNDEKSSDEHERNFDSRPILFNKYSFGSIEGCLWKIDFEKIMLKMNLSYKNFDELNNEIFGLDVELDNDDTIDSWNAYLDTVVPDDHLNLHLFDPYANVIHELFEEVISQGSNNNNKIEKEDEKSTRWKIELIYGSIGLKFYYNNGFARTVLDEIYLYGSRIFDNNDIIILTTSGLYIYHYNGNNKTISLNYYYLMNLKVEEIPSEQNLQKISQYYEEFSKPTLPPPNYDSYKLDEWVSYIKNDKSSLLKYGVELLKFAIKEHKLELVEFIYEKCINYFKQDVNNRMFLSIISTTVPLLNESYPGFILRYSLETDMILDSSSYEVEHRDNNLHLYSFFQNPHLVKNTQYNTFWAKFMYLYTTIFLEHQPVPTITFMIPYIKFVNYSQNYHWFKDWIKPQPSPFIETVGSKEIYNTWNGEALINFKWHTYGKYYYSIIWMIFMVLFGCFTAAAIPQQYYIDDNVRKRLFIITIILGLVHLTFEIRQILYNPKKWAHDFWNMFDIIAYVLPIYTSIYWLQTNDNSDQFVHLLAFSCLFLDFKFLLFFRVFESFGVYFAIIISVGKQIVYFLVVLFIILMSFAHAFHILLSPRTPVSFDNPIDFNTNDDEFNPWNVASTYKLVENGAVNPDQFIIQQPDQNTNMFIDYGTSLFAMYLFLTGDSSSLTNWTYKNHASLVIIMVLFSLLIVVYLMNLLIGLLNMAIEKDKDRVSYLIQKAEVLAEIELYYLLPHQRRWKTWFPEVIYYYADVDKTREKVKDMISKNEWNTDRFPEMKKNLLKKLDIY